MSGISNLPCGGDGKLDGFQLYEYKFSTDGNSSSDSNPSITFRGKGFLVLMASDNIDKVVLETENKRITISKTGSFYPTKTFSLSPSGRQYCVSKAQYTDETHYLTMNFLRDTKSYQFVDLSKTNTVSIPYDDFRYLYYEPKNVLTFNEFLKVTFNFSSTYDVNRNIMILYKPE